MDPTFSNDGITAAPFALDAQDVALQLDGMSVVVGRANGVAAAVRYRVDGSLDTSFGVNGLAQLPVLQVGNAVAIDHTSGAILVCGTADGGEDGTHPAVGRLTSAGAMDPSFGAGGYAITNVAGESSDARDILVQRDHRIVIVGATGEDGLIDFDYDSIAIRYLEGGQIDSSFGGGDGVAQIGFGADDVANGVAIDYTPLTTDPRYGSIVMVGNRQDGTDYRFAVSRLTPAGVLDNTFDGNGQLTTVFPGGSFSNARAVTIQAGSKVVVTGTLAVDFNSSQQNFITARYLSNGAPDPTFGPGANGYSETDMGGNDAAFDIATNYDGGLTVSGQSNQRFALASYSPNGVLDTQFSSDGRQVYGQLPVNHLGVPVRMAMTGTDISPARRIVLAGGNSGQAARIIDVAPIITVSLIDGETSETAGNNATFRVQRTNARPLPQRVFFNTSGVAKKPNTFGSTGEYDYTSPNMSFGNGLNSNTYVDIPANSSSVDVTIVGFNDNLTEGDEIGTFSVAQGTTYEVGEPSFASIIVRDNEPQGSPTTTGITFQFETLPMTVKFTFSQNVGASLSIDDFFIGPATHPRPTFAYNASLNTATLSWAQPLPNGYFGARVIAAGVFNSAGTHLNADSFNLFGFLHGDANRDGVVDFADLIVLAQNYGQTGRTFSQGNFDFSADGSVDFPDLVILAQQYNASLSLISSASASVVDLPTTRRKKPAEKVSDVVR